MEDGNAVPYEERVNERASEFTIARWPVALCVGGIALFVILMSMELQDEALGVLSFTGLVLLASCGFGSDTGLRIEQQRAEIARLNRRLREAEALKEATNEELLAHRRFAFSAYWLIRRAEVLVYERQDAETVPLSYPEFPVEPPASLAAQFDTPDVTEFAAKMDAWASAQPRAD